MKRKWLIGIGILGALFLCWFMATLQSCGLIASPEPIPTFAATATRAPATATIVLPTPTKRPPTPTPIKTVEEWRGVYIGMPIDDVLGLWGKPLRSEKMGEEWIYNDVIIVSKRWTEGGITCYRVYEIRLR